MDGRNTIKLSLCEKCKRLDGRPLIIAMRRDRCLLCGHDTKSFDGPDELIAYLNPKGKSKFPKNVQRFPRDLAASAEQQAVVNSITQCCKDFDCPGKITEVRQGPVVTEYQFQPDRTTRIHKVKTLAEDLAVLLKVENVSMQRMPGYISVFIPNKERKQIEFNDTLNAYLSHREDMELPIDFGMTSVGEPYIEDLTKLPHLLVAGSTGKGKSIFLHNLIDKLLLVRNPKQVNFIFIDPKSVELFQYKEIPHLFRGIKPEAETFRALALLETIVQEMKRRTANLHGFNCQNIKELNDRIKQEAKMLLDAGKIEEAKRRADDIWPYIVVVIDEMSDLIMSEKKSFTDRLAQISAMSRAAGIHLICATQRPSVDVLSGKIKVNFNGRVAFQVPSVHDSKTVLEAKGAENLLGNGDLFYNSPLRAGIQRIHAPFCRKADTVRTIKLATQLGYSGAVAADAPTEAPNAETPNPQALPKTAIN